MSSSRFHPIEEGVWDDPKLDGLSFEGHAFFVYLFSNYRQRPSGIYRSTDAQIAADTGIKIRQVVSYLSVLHKRMASIRDGSWIFLPGYLKRQSKNDRLLLGVQADILRCDSEVILKHFSEKYPLYSSWSTDRLQTLRNSAPSDQTITDQTRPSQTITSMSSRALPEQVEWGISCCLILKYNKETPDNVPTVRSLSTARLKREREFLTMFPDEQWWSVTFQQYKRSKFLQGIVQSDNGHKSFKPDFDWLLSKGKDGIENCVKVHDGRYRDG